MEVPAIPKAAKISVKQIMAVWKWIDYIVMELNYMLIISTW